jgi:hypothetical protein
MSNTQDHPDIEQLPLAVEGVPVRETVRELFRNPENGTPDNISKAGCWAFACKSNELSHDFFELNGHTQGNTQHTAIVWNCWRQTFPVEGSFEDPVNHANFEGASFEGLGLSFADFQFGDFANFEATRWGDSANCIAAQWGHHASFERARWGDNANFRDAQWGDTANFKYAAWGSNASFNSALWRNKSDFAQAAWGDRADFSNAKWGYKASFRLATWGSYALFRNCQWGDHASFGGAQWGNSCGMFGARWGDFASFDGARWGINAKFIACQWGINTTFDSAVWGANANFQGAQWAKYVVFSYACFLGDVDFSAKAWGELQWVYGAQFEDAQTWAEDWNAGPNQFPKVVFQGVWFGGIASFANRRFCQSTKFNRVHANTSKPIRIDINGLEWDDDDALAQATKKQDGAVHFLDAPLFHGCELHQDTSFDSATFPEAAGNDEAARAYRTLKLAFSKQQAIREEQRFFRLEMEEETLRATGLKRWLFEQYKRFSDYGFSITRPLRYDGLAALVLTAVYGLLSWLGQCVLGSACAFAPQWLEFSLLNTLPLPGLDKSAALASTAFWPGGAFWSLALSMLLMLHKTISLAALFLVGLALRNLFKLK